MTQRDIIEVVWLVSTLCVDKSRPVVLCVRCLAYRFYLRQVARGELMKVRLSVFYSASERTLMSREKQNSMRMETTCTVYI